MTDRIDPGPGWRLLSPKEIVKHGDERWAHGEWVLSLNAGLKQSCGFVYRRRRRTAHHQGHRDTGDSEDRIRWRHDNHANNAQ